MANQMIALGVKAPQTDILGSSIARNAQMINMMRQQDAAERQTAVAQQQMQIARAQEERAAAKDQREASAADIELAGKKIDHYTKLAGQTMNPQGYTLLLNQLDKDAPDIAAAFRANLPPEKFDRNVLLQMVGSIGDNFSATYGPRETEVVVDEKGDYFVAVTGGFGPQGMVPLNTLIPGGPPKPSMSKPAPAPRGGPAAPALSPDAALPAGGVDARPTRGSATTPEDLRMQGVDPRSIPMGNPFKPASFDGGAAQPDLGAVVQQMMETGVVSQSDFNAMRAAAPGKDAQLAEILRANNIQIMPDEQQPGGLQSAVYRPGEGDASMTQVQSLEGYQDTGRQFRGKSPMQGPLPGSSQVPLGRVRAEAQAGRETPAEAAAKTRATKRAEIEVEREKALPAKQQVSKIISKIRDAYTNLNNAEAIPSSKRGAAANVWDYLSVSAPGREIQRAFGTETSKSLTDITASRKLLATAIKNATGMSAQEMNSNVELQLMLDALTDPTQGYESALSVLGTLEDLYGTPKNTTAARPGAKKVVRTGTANGRRVVQYSDGTIDYAD